MERLSSIHIFDSGAEMARTFSNGLGLRVGQISGWLRDKSRQIRSFPGNEELIRAVFSSEKVPVEGARYHVGDRINIYRPDGGSRRLRIFGVRSGGFSNVYTVIDLDEMRPYCLKENRALPGDENEKNEKLAIEAKISLRLGTHPNILKTYAAVFYHSRLMILTEYLSATSLDELLKKAELTVSKALSYGIQLSRAMRRAQVILPGFIHGDIKPGNCLITSDGQLKLGDFGLASADGIHDHGSADQAVQTDTTKGWGGTTAYMAPEMFDEAEPQRDKADIYAFGATLFELFAGRNPFAADSKRKTIEMHCNAEPPTYLLEAKGIPKNIIRLVAACLAKSPQDRPESFEIVEDELGRTMQNELDLEVPMGQIREFTNSEIAERALSLAMLGDSHEAAVYIDLAACRSDMSAEFHACKAIALALGSHIDEAYEASTLALMEGAKSFVVLLAHGQVLSARGEMEGAEEYFLRALQLEPNNCMVLNLLGNLYLATGQYRESAVRFERSRKLDALQIEPWEGIGRANLLRGNTDEAIDLLRKALVIDPRHASVYGHLGDAYRTRGELVAAINSYKTALGFGLRSDRVAEKFVRSSIDLYESEGHTVSGRLAAALERASIPFRQSGEADAVRDLITDFVSVLRENEFEPLLLFFFDRFLADAAGLFEAKDRQRLVRALHALQERRDLHAAPAHALESIGRVLYYLSEFNGCRSIFQGMLDRFGPNERSFYYLAACNEIAGDYHESLRQYEAALEFEDCEDTRTGIRRVKAKIDQGRNAGSQRSGLFQSQ